MTHNPPVPQEVVEALESLKIIDAIETTTLTTPSPQGVVESLKREIHKRFYPAHSYDPYAMIEITKVVNYLAARGYLTTPPQPEWQDISTAPRDGYIIGAWKEGTKWRTAQLLWVDTSEDWINVHSDFVQYPTHWMPLPQPPRATEGGGV